MSNLEIACCGKCHVPVQTLDESGLQHKCANCNVIMLDDDLIFLDFEMASINARIVAELNKSIALVDHSLELLTDIRKAFKND